MVTEGIGGTGGRGGGSDWQLGGISGIASKELCAAAQS